MDWKIDLDNAFSDLLTRRKLALLLLCWLTGILAFFYYRAWFPCEACLAGPAPMDLSVLESNETGPFASLYTTGPAESESGYLVEFDNLWAENGRLGLFRTASNKTACIDNLRVTFCQNDTLGARPEIDLDAFYDLFAPPEDGLSRDGRIGVLTDLQGQDLQDRVLGCSASVDMTKTTLVQIRRMNWEVRCADRTILKVECRRACLEGDTSYVLLQGHATVTTPTATLEGNCIKMNVRDNCFVVDGRYLLTRDGRRVSGVGGCFDTELKPYQIASSDGKERNEWTHEYLFAAF
jgi:hypothetical protein